MIPTEPGFYWFREFDDSVNIAYVGPHPLGREGLRFSAIGYEGNHPLDYHAVKAWLGKAESPE